MAFHPTETDRRLRDEAEAEKEAERRRRAQREGLSGEDFFTQLLVAFFQAFLGFDDTRDAPDFDDAPDRETAERARTSYRAGADSYQTVDSASLRQYAQTLADLRAKAGGEVPIIPVRGEVLVTSAYGMRTHPITGEHKQHSGVDLAPASGGKPEIIAPVSGVVIAAGYRGGYGNVVDIMGVDGKTHRFAHLDSIRVKPGTVLAQADTIGVMGTSGRSTGVHLHYEQRTAEGAQNPRLMGQTLAKGERFNGAAIAQAAAATRGSALLAMNGGENASPPAAATPGAQSLEVAAASPDATYAPAATPSARPAPGADRSGGPD